MKNLPRGPVTVGMPVFNGGEFVGKSIESWLNQTFVNFRLVIFDNASSDNTETVVRDYLRRDERIFYSRRNENVGAWSNFMELLGDANTPLFCWAAADDLYSPDWLERLVAGFSPGDGIGAFGTVKQIDHLGNLIADHPAHGNSFPYTAQQIRGVRLASFLWDNERRGKANIWYSLFDRAELARCVSKTPEDTIQYDSALILELLREGPIVSIPGPTLWKRIDLRPNQDETDSATDCDGRRCRSDFSFCEIRGNYWSIGLVLASSTPYWFRKNIFEFLILAPMLAIKLGLRTISNFLTGVRGRRV